MISNGIELCDSMTAYLQADTNLSYIDTFTQQIWEESPFPEFGTRCLVVSPEAFQFNLKSFQQMQQTFCPSLVCIVKNFDPVLSIFGTTQDIGIIKMVYDTWFSMWKYLYEHQNELDIRYDELTEKIPIKTRRTAENKDFYWWVKIPLGVKLRQNTFEEINQ